MSLKKILGSKKVRVRTCGKEKVRLSVCFAATASGKKLNTICVVPRKKQIPNLHISDDFVLVYDTKGKINII